MLLFCPTWLYLWPGLIFTIYGVSTLLLLVRGPFLFLGHHWDIHMLVLSSLVSILGYEIVNLGLYAKTFAVREGYLRYDKIVFFLLRHFKLEVAIIIGLLLFTVGVGINLAIFLEWWHKSFGPLHRIRESVLAMTFMVLGLQTVFSSFFVSLLLIKR
jgi:hypothetical protein